MILSTDQAQDSPRRAVAPRAGGDLSDELLRAKLAVLSVGRRPAGTGRRSWARNPLVLGVGLFVAGVMIGRWRVLRTTLTAAAVFAGRTLAHKVTARALEQLKL